MRKFVLLVLVSLALLAFVAESKRSTKHRKHSKLARRGRRRHSLARHRLHHHKARKHLKARRHAKKLSRRRKSRSTRHKKHSARRQKKHHVKQSRRHHRKSRRTLRGRRVHRRRHIKRAHRRRRVKHSKRAARKLSSFLQAFKAERRKLMQQVHRVLGHRSERQLNYADLPGKKPRYRNPYYKPQRRIDSEEQKILDYFAGPKSAKQGAPRYSLINANYYLGQTKFVGNPIISEVDAISQMNYEQYFNHLERIMAFDKEDQKLLNNYFSDRNAELRMLNFRDTRDVIFESILSMEEMTYKEQKEIIEELYEKAVIFEEKERDKVIAMMLDEQGKPYYQSLPHRDDIFV